MKLYSWNVGIQIQRYYYLFFIGFVFLLVVNCYHALIVFRTSSIINFFAIIFSLNLFYFMEKAGEVTLKKHVFHLFSLSVFILVLCFCPMPLWIVVSINNFFAILYFGFFYLFWIKSGKEYKLFRSYIFTIHLLFVTYLLTLNLQIYFGNHNLKDFVLLLYYMQVGVQGLLLILTLLSCFLYIKGIKVSDFETFFSFDNYLGRNIMKSDLEVFNQKQEGKRFLLKYKNQTIIEQILDFFETEKVYLKSEFSLEILSKYVPNSNEQVISLVINKYMNTTFYKLVAYYRIMYALDLLIEKSSWTLAA